jgi:hypothetical protein
MKKRKPLPERRVKVCFRIEEETRLALSEKATKNWRPGKAG